MLRKLSIALMAALLCLAPALAFADSDIENTMQLAPWMLAGVPRAQTVFSAHATAAAVSASMPAVAGQKNYLYSAYTSCQGTATTGVEFTVTGLQGGTLFIESPALGASSMSRVLTPASAPNTAITISGTAATGQTCAVTLIGVSF